MISLFFLTACAPSEPQGGSGSPFINALKKTDDIRQTAAEHKEEVDRALRDAAAATSSPDAAYTQCMNKAYNEYKTNYDEACSKVIIDGTCVVSNEKRYELDGIYMHEKEQCEKLKP